MLLDPPPVPAPDADATAGEVVATALARAEARILEHGTGLRSGNDPEDVHQARVGTRRLRSHLRTFHGLIDPAWRETLRDAIKPFADRLGAVRDADVLLARLRRRVAQLDEKDRLAGGRLLSRLEAQRAQAHRTLLAWMDGPDHGRLVARLGEAAREPALRPGAEAPALEALGPLLKRPWRRLARSARAAATEAETRALHRVRIRAKAMRYAVESLEPVVGRRARALARALAEIQDVLGEHQDATVAMAWLREAARSAPGDEAFVAGSIAAWEELAAEQARARWPETWRRARRRKLRSWL